MGDTSGSPSRTEIAAADYLGGKEDAALVGVVNQDSLMISIQPDPQLLRGRLGQLAEFGAVSSMKSLNRNLIRPAADLLPVPKRLPEVLRTTGLQASEQLVPEVSEHDVPVCRNRRFQTEAHWVIRFVCLCIQRLMDMVVFAPARLSFDERIDHSPQVAHKRDLIHQVHRPWMTATPTVVQPSEHREHRVLHHVRTCDVAQAGPGQPLIRVLPELPISVIGQRLDELVTPLSCHWRSCHAFVFGAYSVINLTQQD